MCHYIHYASVVRGRMILPGKVSRLAGLALTNTSFGVQAIANKM
ncbi:hypothetical protein [Alteromonas sp. H39]